jgi:hypothetical protein
MEWDGWWHAGVAALTLYVLGVARGWMRQASGRRMLPEFAPQLRAARRFDIWAGPLTGAAVVAGLVACMIGNTISWRGNRYRIERGGQIKQIPTSVSPVAGQIGAAPPLAQEYNRRNWLRRSA